MKIIIFFRLYCTPFWDWYMLRMDIHILILMFLHWVQPSRISIYFVYLLNGFHRRILESQLNSVYITTVYLFNAVNAPKKIIWTHFIRLVFFYCIIYLPYFIPSFRPPCTSCWHTMRQKGWTFLLFYSIIFRRLLGEHRPRGPCWGGSSSFCSQGSFFCLCFFMNIKNWMN